jgi:predicted methyltransferase
MRKAFNDRASILFGFLALMLVGAGVTTPTPARAQDYGALLGAPDRSEQDRQTDERRKPAQLLAFAGVRPGMKVLDLGAGGGYTTELLARAVGPDGVVYAVIPQPPREQLQARIKSPVGQKIVPIVQKFDAPLPAEARELDVVTFVLNYHDAEAMGVDRAAMNRNLFDALKPGGVFIVVDHAAKAGDGASVGRTLHRIEEGTVRSEVEAAGFKLASEGDFLRNPNDARDATSERNPATDRFVLKFEKR